VENGAREKSREERGGAKKRYQFIVVVVDMAASSTFPLYGWRSVSTLDTFQKSRNRKHQCRG